MTWSAGCAWFVGAFLLTLWMRLLALVGVPFSVWSIGIPLLVVAAAGPLLGLRRGRPQWTSWREHALPR